MSRWNSPTEINHPIHLADSTLDHRAHVCAFFNGPDEEYQMLLPFIKEGIELGQKSVHTINPRLRADHNLRLASAGIEVDAVLQNGQLELLDWSTTHLPKGHFDQHETLSLYRRVMDEEPAPVWFRMPAV